MQKEGHVAIRRVLTRTTNENPSDRLDVHSRNYEYVRTRRPVISSLVHLQVSYISTICRWYSGCRRLSLSNGGCVRPGRRRTR